MKTKLLLLALLITSSALFSQSIGFLGDFSGWNEDVNMDTADNITYTKTNYYLPATGLKFRQDDAWTNNWGGDTFPSGSSTGNNIPVTAGFYDISFNRTTGTYNFTAVAGTNQNVSIIGEFNAWAADVTLTTSDNLNYSAMNVPITAGGLKFRRDANWAVNFGSTALSGIAVSNSADNIPIPVDGNYNIIINIETLAFSVVNTLATDNFSTSSINIFSYDDKINIKGLDITSSYSLSIFDTLGRQVKSLDSNTEIIDISELTPAIYFLVLETEEGNTIKKKIIKK